MKNFGFLSYEMRYLLPGAILLINLISLAFLLNLIDFSIILSSDYSIFLGIISLPLIIPLIFLLGRSLSITEYLFKILVINKVAKKSMIELCEMWKNCDVEEKQKIIEFFNKIKICFQLRGSNLKDKNNNLKKKLDNLDFENLTSKEINFIKVIIWRYFYYKNRRDLVDHDLNLIVMTKYSTIALIISLFCSFPWIFNPDYYFISIVIFVYCMIQIIMNIIYQFRAEKDLIIDTFRYFFFFATSEN